MQKAGCSRAVLIGGESTKLRLEMLSAPLQTPIPTSESEIVLIIGAFVWFLVMFLVGRRLDKIAKRHSDIISFLIFVAGLFILIFLLY